MQVISFFFNATYSNTEVALVNLRSCGHYGLTHGSKTKGTYTNEIVAIPRGNSRINVHSTCLVVLLSFKVALVHSDETVNVSNRSGNLLYDLTSLECLECHNLFNKDFSEKTAAILTAQVDIQICLHLKHHFVNTYISRAPIRRTLGHPLLSYIQYLSQKKRSGISTHLFLINLSSLYSFSKQSSGLPHSFRFRQFSFISLQQTQKDYGP